MIRLADPEGAKMLLKCRVLEFFRMGGFLHLDILGEEQRRLLGEEQFNDDETMWDLMAESVENRSDDER